MTRPLVFRRACLTVTSSSTRAAETRAVGRCTLDLATLLGLCTFSDGTGRFSGFQARVEVSYLGTDSDFAWDGTYSFNSTG